MNVLVVDDSTIMQKKISRIFNEHPEVQKVTTAGNGTQAIECFRSGAPHIVTLDITMPEMDGLSCLRWMMAENPDCIIFIITALNDVETGLRALKLGARGYIKKPFKSSDLLGEIQRLVVPA
ncbi:response regulator transcription factor [Salinispira pacifica]|uniref:Chemotaxis regulator-transmits chemoreceptor signals to flagelllar motor components CheY n=1 Tax=Salinispira pacifica TaxID=1307761 RepID=V5WGK9_9SPIO|nr:response regulator [Salinispira pacifica]AHC14967.1 Chemotaxis regulator - transmits chemoreceptor signals to flagelllar motor components CheY [Salinispira pacifica]